MKDVIGHRWAAAVTCAVLLATGCSAANAAPQRFTSGVHHYADGAKIGRSSARLTTDADRSMLVLRTFELGQGPHTAWWIVFNNPQYCGGGFAPGFECGPDDLPQSGGDERVELSVVHAQGAVVGRRSAWAFKAVLAVEDDSRALFGPGLVNPHEAEIHVLIRSHGPAAPGFEEQQLTEFEGSCGEGEPNDGLCDNEQFAAFSQRLS